MAYILASPFGLLFAKAKFAPKNGAEFA